MNRRSAITMLVAPGAGLLVGFAAGNAKPKVAPKKKGAEEDFTLRSDVRLVLLDVSVKDRKGGFASGLTKENFRVEENGRMQPITVFSHDDTPVTIGILVDESRSMIPRHTQVITAASVFIDECNRKDEMFVLHFNDRVTAGLPVRRPFSDNVQELHAALMRGRPDGRTALYDAVLDGLKQLELGRRTKKALVLISDGGDTASIHQRRELLDMVEASAATIYSVGLFDDEDPYRTPGLLRQLASMSGGLAFFPANDESLVLNCRQMAQEIRTRYTVGYVPQPGDAELRHVKVRVAAPGQDGFVVRTRSTYRYAEAPE